MRFMRKHAFLLLIFSAYFSIIRAQSDPGINGAFPQGWYSETISRDGRNMNCRIYYPAFSDGENAPADTISGPYPVVAFGHGFFMQTSYYISLYRRLASHGFIVIAPQFSDTRHGELGRDLIYCLGFIQTSSATPGNRLYGIADPSKKGVSGHSMGGGASLLATTYDSTITIAAPLAAAETNPTIIGTIQNSRSYIYLISAQNDGITPPATTQIPMYNNSPGNKGLLTIKGGNHTKFMDTGIFDFTDPNGYLSRTKQIYLSQKYLTAAFKLFLYEDKSYWKYVFGDSVDADTSVLIEKSVSTLPLAEYYITSPGGTYPDSAITFKWQKTSTLNPGEEIFYRAELALDSLFTQLFYISAESQDSSVTIDSLPSGLYHFRVMARTIGGVVRFSSNMVNLIITPSTGADESGVIPSQFSLSSPYPNPFNPSFSVILTVPEAMRVRIKITDITGKEVYNESGIFDAGRHEKSFRMDEFPSGIYFVMAEVKNQKFIRKLLLLK